jgi:DNA-binding CsgD family transcriptional regulator
MLAALPLLAATDRAIVAFRFFSGMRIGPIACLLKIHPNTVARKLEKANARLNFLISAGKKQPESPLFIMGAALFPAETRVVQKEYRDGGDMRLSKPCEDYNLAVADELMDVDPSCRTDRQREIISLRIEGRTDAEIADRLGVSESTVRNDRHLVEAVRMARSSASVA